VVVPGNRRQVLDAFPFASLRFLLQPLPKCLIVAAPSEKPEIPADETRCDVRGNEGRLDRKGARAAHQIHERLALGHALGPIREQQDRGGEVLF